MPAFSTHAGGTLTDRQSAVLAHGMVDTWSNPGGLAGQQPPAYAGSLAGDPVHGAGAYQAYCARCHGADGTGLKDAHTGLLVDPSYRALVSDQSLRSNILAGRPADNMPDWRADVPGHPMTETEIADTVAWLGDHRSPTPGQPYRQHP